MAINSLSLSLSKAIEHRTYKRIYIYIYIHVHANEIGSSATFKTLVESHEKQGSDTGNMISIYADGRKKEEINTFID